MGSSYRLRHIFSSIPENSKLNLEDVFALVKALYNNKITYTSLVNFLKTSNQTSETKLKELRDAFKKFYNFYINVSKTQKDVCSRLGQINKTMKKLNLTYYSYERREFLKIIKNKTIPQYALYQLDIATIMLNHQLKIFKNSKVTDEKALVDAEIYFHCLKIRDILYDFNLL